MKLDAETREKIADIVYELDVDPEDVDKVVNQIEAAMSVQKIEINAVRVDMAGAMENITPDMMDTMKDAMIEALTRRSTQMLAALKPFADKVFNDNGITVQDSHRLTTEDFAKAYFAFRGGVPAEPQCTPTGVRPANCRERLRKEGKPYPRSSCEGCGTTIATGLWCPYD